MQDNHKIWSEGENSACIFFWGMSSLTNSTQKIVKNENIWGYEKHIIFVKRPNIIFTCEKWQKNSGEFSNKRTNT